MKSRIILLFICVLNFSAEAQEGSLRMSPDSVISQEHAKELRDVSVNWLNQYLKKPLTVEKVQEKLAKDPVFAKGLAHEMNTRLKKLGYPLIDRESPDFTVSVVGLKGFSGTSFEGINIVDGKNKFCFPCESGHNNFIYGVMPAPTPGREVPAKPEGRFFEHLACFESLENVAGPFATKVNSEYRSRPRVMPLIQTWQKDKGLFLLTADGFDFYQVDVPWKWNRDYLSPRQYELPLEDGRKTIIEVTPPQEKKGSYTAQEALDRVRAEPLTRSAVLGHRPEAQKILADELVARIEASGKHLEEQLDKKSNLTDSQKRRLRERACAALTVCKRVNTFGNKRIMKEIEDEWGDLDCKKIPQGFHGVGTPGPSRH